jgi:hypothetical protein
MTMMLIGGKRRHQHQADDRNKQRQKEEDGTALDAFSAVFDAEETWCRRCFL